MIHFLKRLKRFGAAIKEHRLQPRYVPQAHMQGPVDRYAARLSDGGRSSRGLNS